MNQKQNGSVVIILIVLVTIVCLGFVAYKTYFRTGPDNTIQPVETRTNLPKPIPTPSTKPGFTSYYDEILDITFEYPSDWKLSKGSYLGDIALTADNACDYLKNSTQRYLKDINACDSSTIKNYSPGLDLVSPDGKSKVEFAGPTSDLGGACFEPDCIANPQTSVSIRGKTFILDTSQVVATKVRYETLFGPDPIGIPTGTKSIWTKFDVYLQATDQQNFDTELGILESIK